MKFSKAAKNCSTAKKSCLSVAEIQNPEFGIAGQLLHYPVKKSRHQILPAAGKCSAAALHAADIF